MTNPERTWWPKRVTRRIGAARWARGAADRPKGRPFLEVWRDNVSPYDDARLERLGVAVANGLETGAAALRRGLAEALLSNVPAEVGAAKPSHVHAWSCQREELADERAWDAENRGDPDGYSRCFRQARAYGALREATADVDDASAVQGAFYELLHAVEDAGDVLAICAAGPVPWPGIVRATYEP